MKVVFADTLYWVAVIHPDDPWHQSAIRAGQALGRHRLITTDWVLTGFLAHMGRGAYLRALAADFVRSIFADKLIIVITQTRELFLKGLDLFEKRSDKSFSLVDCVSMVVMHSMSVRDVLTNDSHFSQEGFNVLIRRRPDTPR